MSLKQHEREYSAITMNFYKQLINNVETRRAETETKPQRRPEGGAAELLSAGSVPRVTLGHNAGDEQKMVMKHTLYEHISTA